ncbi:PKD domain-containing protein [Parafilimonas terrae]|uniref:Gliding motility-associated C-terminal domain-containing protein n=1 Tax=Parafilimonas terrae TaxID=1465490 RepID=A0A1I5UXD3_9BACT|nr:PKD domain-containing protein [Parafilimonas terrae]SFP99915.1 gliding motility-associated C-terminal domain-containing protein [Parafilimonas terrae]
MRAGCIFLLLVFIGQHALAHHVKGGYIRYEYAGAGASSGTSKYKVTVTVFYGCGVEGPRTSVTLRALNGATGSQVLSTTINTTTSATSTKKSFSSCMVNPPTICYEIYTYVTTITLTDITAGYVLAVTDEYRTDNIINIANSSSTGIAITATIPGNSGADYHENTSPVFDFKDTAIVCYKEGFNYQFAASDPVDNDSLSYSFGNGLNTSSSSSAPFFASLTYNSGYSGASPMGSGVTINPKTGLISGTAPTTTGEFVMAVYVKEWRNGVLIDSVKKELQIYVYNCSLTAAELAPSYTNCDSFTTSFKNEASASNISSYYWDFGVSGTNADVSTEATPSYTYPDTGVYTVKLKVVSTSGCSDSTTSQVAVYPAFSPGFTVSGNCYQSPFLFNDTSYIKYGYITYRLWNFGDETTAADTSSLKTVSYTYPSAATRTATLSITSSKGCSETVSKTVNVTDKPDLSLAFSDTLICSIDTLQLQAYGNGNFVWTGNNIINANSSSPYVYPKDTTQYIVTLTEKSCVASDTVTVNVVDNVSLNVMPDTTICTTDSMQIFTTSNALHYQWSPSTYLSSDTAKQPLAFPPNNTTYTVMASIGKCVANDAVQITTVPYPAVTASNDTSICYGNTAQLSATINGSSFTWLPVTSLVNANTLTPVAGPMDTTAYAITVYDTLGCPKPSTDVVVVNVVPKVNAFAGNDTAVVINQPLQFNASGGAVYLWTPSTYLNNPAIYNPVGTYHSADTITYTVKVSTAEGCYAYDDIKVYVFTTKPDIFVPTGFTPNHDGLNDVEKPILVGIKSFKYFGVYNRWGQRVFFTEQQGKGWDGTWNGTPQPAGTYVFIALGTDYTNKEILRKGTFVLIR